MRLILASLALAATAVPAAADAAVVQQDERGFRIIHIAETDASPDQVWRTLVEPKDWWVDAHSFTGDASNFSLEAAPGGCFCEISDKLGVEHARVLYIEPGVRLRLNGALGPLQQEAVMGILTFALKERAGGGTTISIEYAVSGNFRTAPGTIAPGVDRVIVEQGNSLAKAALKAMGKSGAAEKPKATEESADDADDKDADFGEAFGDTPEPQR